MNHQPDEFDGAHEKLHMERGESYGLSRECYWSVANASMAVKEFGDIQPCSIEKLPDRPGCRVTLFGKHFCFSLTVDGSSEPASMQLAATGLDDATGELFQVLSRIDCPSDWTRVIHSMLETDGLANGYVALTYAEATELMRRQGLLF